MRYRVEEGQGFGESTEAHMAGARPEGAGLVACFLLLIREDDTSCHLFHPPFGASSTATCEVHSEFHGRAKDRTSVLFNLYLNAPRASALGLRAFFPGQLLRSQAS